MIATGTLADRAWWTLKRRPEALLLFAAGSALLMSGTRTGNSSNTWRPSNTSGGRRAATMGSSASRSMNNISDQVQSASQQTQDYVRNVADQARERASQVADTASDYAESLTRYAVSARDTVADQGGAAIERARSLAQTNLEYLLKEQPIALGLIAFAAGAAIGAALPETEVENRTLGAQRDQLAHMAMATAEEQIEQLKATAGTVGERVVNAVKEQGMSAEGLKQAAASVAESLREPNAEAQRGNNDKGQGQGRSDDGRR
jgi:hypothetical protein